MADRVFGELPGVPEGTLFEDRTELSKAGVHRPRQAGICEGKGDSADSIVLLAAQAGYETNYLFAALEIDFRYDDSGS